MSWHIRITGSPEAVAEAVKSEGHLLPSTRSAIAAALGAIPAGQNVYVETNGNVSGGDVHMQIIVKTVRTVPRK